MSPETETKNSLAAVPAPIELGPAGSTGEAMLPGNRIEPGQQNLDVLSEPTYEFTDHKEVPPSVEALDSADRYLMGAAGALALVGVITGREVKDRFTTYASGFALLKTRAVEHIRRLGHTKFDKQLSVYSQSMVEPRVEDARRAHTGGDQAMEAKHLDAIESRLSAAANLPRLYRLAERWSLIDPVAEHQASVMAGYKARVEAAAVPLDTSVPAQAKAAKEAGDWTKYNLLLQDMADKVEHNKTAGALDKNDVARIVGQTDKLLNATDNEAPDNRKVSLERKKDQLQQWINPSEILSLKQAIADEIRLQTEKASVLGDNLLVGHTKEDIERAAYEKYASEYLGIPADQLGNGEAVPVWIQNKVMDMLALPTHELKQRAESKQTKVKANPKNHPAHQDPNVIPLKQRSKSQNQTRRQDRAA